MKMEMRRFGIRVNSKNKLKDIDEVRRSQDLHASLSWGTAWVPSDNMLGGFFKQPEVVVNGYLAVRLHDTTTIKGQGPYEYFHVSWTLHPLNFILQEDACTDHQKSVCLLVGS